MTETKSGSHVSGLIGWIAVVMIVWFILPGSWTDSFLYSTTFQITDSQVHRLEKPTDCEFLHAPLGDKGCHYKKVVTAYNAAGEIVGGDNAPIYDKNKDNNTIVSYDEGKTWQLMSGFRPDSKVSRVDIYWIKTTE